GGQCELIRNGHNGLLIPAEDHVALASAFEFLSRNPQQAQEFGVRARETIVTRFSQEEQVAALAELLRNTHHTRARDTVAPAATPTSVVLSQPGGGCS